MGEGERDLVERAVITALVTTVPWQSFPGPWRNGWSVGGGWVLLEGLWVNWTGDEGAITGQRWEASTPLAMTANQQQ